MDRFSPEKLLGEIFWDEPAAASYQSDFVIEYSQSSHNGSNSQDMKDGPPPAAAAAADQSAFVQYRDPPRVGFGEESSQNAQNMSKRMIELLRKSGPVDGTTKVVTEYERERCFRHVINERMRRQRQRQCCLALHSMLPHGTKTDNNSVIQMAAKEIQRLQGCKEELQKKNFVLVANLERNRVGGSKVQLRVPYPTSGIDSLVETLKCLKGVGVNTTSIKSNFSTEELFAVLETEAKIADGEVERAIQRTVDEVEAKLHSRVCDWEGSERQRI